MSKEPPPAGLTRRGLVNLAGRAGGISAAYATMRALGLFGTPAAHAGPPDLPPGSGRGQRVLILGAGIAGLAAAHELGKAGYDCTILEARERPGGRAWTLRRGSRVAEHDSVQSVNWAPGADHYFNVGPARIPHHHKALLAYCREFAIPLQIIMNDNRNALAHDAEAFGGRPVRMRHAIGDIKGHLAELLAKTVSQSALDAGLNGLDKEKLLAFVKTYGQLSKEYAYKGSALAGYAEPPGAGTDFGKLDEPLALKAMLRSEFWLETTEFGSGFDQSGTMLQPVGGMDRIARAFAQRLKSKIRYEAIVKQIRRVGTSGARIVFQASPGRGKPPVEQALEANHVIVTIPLTVLKLIDSDFSPPHKTAIAAGPYMPAAKVAFQAKRRFWEEDEQIYGGISWTNQDITQIWYPSTGFHGRSGIVVGAYIWTPELGEKFARLSPDQRIELAMAQAEKLHPKFRSDVDNGIAVSWANIPYSAGAWCEWSEADRSGAYRVLLEPDGPFHLAGEHLSNLPGWQEGAILSAYKAIEAITARNRP